MTEEQPDRPRNVTIYDVAKEAGVAASTVSRALSRPGRVSAETAQRVHEVAKRLGYRERSAAASEPGRRSKVLLVSAASVGNLFFWDTLNGIEDEAALAGYSVVLVNARDNAAVEKLSLERALPLADGIIMISPRSSDAVVQQFSRVRPLVAINRLVPEVASVVQNSADGMAQVAEHLKELGHKNTTYVGSSPSAWIQGARWEALEAACHTRGIVVRKIGPYEPTVRGGVSAVQQWLTYPTSAVVCFNDDLALGFSYGVRERNLRVPEDVSIVGIDNTMASSVFAPPLSTLAVAGHGQGAVATRRVLAELNGTVSRTAPIVVPMRLIKRASTAQAPVRG